ncbi:MAG: MMPL family transporter, partial [Deltaproteobacteria bacterium]|nr:MMPL family transporter [Deltaproteobacteria bacterium]
MSLSESSERAFERWGHLSYAHPWKVIGLMILVTAGLFIGISELRTDVSTESYLREDDPARVVYNEFRSQFGYDDDIVLIIQSDDIFSLPFLEKLRGIHESLEEELPYTDNVESLISARVTRGEGDELIVEDLFERWPETEAELAVIKTRALANPTYENLFYSKDHSATAVRVRGAPTAGEESQELDAELSFGEEENLSVAPMAVMLEGEELNAVVEAMYAVIERYDSDDFEIAASGGPPITYAILTLMERDMGVFTVVSNLIILTLLALLFRRFSGVFLPWIVVALPLLATFGAMGFLDLAITPTTNILPSLLLAVCVGDGVHILSVFFDKFDQGGSKEEAVVFALGHSGLAVVMTSITTAGSLFSFAFAD